MSIERREQKRFSLNLQAKISYRHIEDQPPVVDTVAANISSGGAFVKTAHRFPLAAKVKIEFHISIDDLKNLRFILSMESLKQLTGKTVWVSASGIVIRQEPDGVGIIFDTDYQLTPMNSSSTTK
jgi:c-di-GMP-binding flagellar brake protein YcgR